MVRTIQIRQAIGELGDFEGGMEAGREEGGGDRGGGHTGAWEVAFCRRLLCAKCFDCIHVAVDGHKDSVEAVLMAQGSGLRARGSRFGSRGVGFGAQELEDSGFGFGSGDQGLWVSVWGPGLEG